MPIGGTRNEKNKKTEKSVKFVRLITQSTNVRGVVDLFVTTVLDLKQVYVTNVTNKKVTKIIYMVTKGV